MMTLHKKLAHLIPEQVDDLVKRYNDDEKLTSLIEAFNIDAKPAGLVHLLPPVVHKDLPCPYLPGHEPDQQAAGENVRPPRPRTAPLSHVPAHAC